MIYNIYKTSDWISVKDKLPKLGEIVLVLQTFVNGNRIVSKAIFVNIDGRETFIAENGDDCYFISHWKRMVLQNEQKSQDVSEMDIIYKQLNEKLEK